MTDPIDNPQNNQGDEPTMDPDTGGNSGFGGQYSDFVIYGLYNGAFARGPADPTANITPWVASDPDYLNGSNFMPNWRFVQSSNTNITAKQVRDVQSPSGSNIRFTFVSGSANDEAYIEQIVDIGGNRGRQQGAVVRAYVLQVSGAASSFDLRIMLQYLTVDNTPIGNATQSVTTASVAGGIVSAVAQATSDSSPSQQSKYLRVRIVPNRTAGTGAGAIDVSDVRVERSNSGVLISERTTPGTYGPGYVAQAAGVLYLTANNLALSLSNTKPGITIDDSTDTITLLGAAVNVLEVAAPSTPPSGRYSIYAKTDSHLYGKNDAGTEVQLDGGGTSSPPTKQIFTANGTWTKPAGCVGAIVECVGSGGGSGSTSTTGAGQASASGGGGGGAYCKTWFDASTLAATESITIGAGGAKATGPGNVAGSAGGDAVFAVGKAYIMTAGGGAGGGGGTASAGTVIRAGGSGGTASGGDVNISGNDGYYGTVSGGSVFVAGYGAGASGPYSASTRPTSTTTTAPGNAGASYGGGASGAATQASQTGQDGAAGAKGVVIITEFY